MVRSAVAVLCALVACRPAPQPLVEGDPCEFCRMAITDTRFGGQVVLTTGRTRSFDAIECLAGYLASGADSSRIGRVLVSDFETGQLVDAATAVFVRDGTVASPMGRSVLALASGAPAEAILARYGGTIATWDAVQRELATTHGHPAAGAGAGPLSPADTPATARDTARPAGAR
jgi:copper chaperone NosL